MIVLYTTFPTEKDARKVGTNLLRRSSLPVSIFCRDGFHLPVGRCHRERERGGNARQNEKRAGIAGAGSAGGEASLFRSRSYRFEPRRDPPPTLSGFATNRLLAPGIRDQIKAPPPQLMLFRHESQPPGKNIINLKRLSPKSKLAFVEVRNHLRGVRREKNGPGRHIKLKEAARGRALPCRLPSRSREHGLFLRSRYRLHRRACRRIHPLSSSSPAYPGRFPNLNSATL